MTDFGDFDDDDAFDPNEPADPEQVARKLRRLYDAGFDDLAVALALLAWLRRQGSLL
jgi:hypothetical protein